MGPVAALVASQAFAETSFASLHTPETVDATLGWSLSLL